MNTTTPHLSRWEWTCLIAHRVWLTAFIISATGASIFGIIWGWWKYNEPPWVVLPPSDVEISNYTDAQLRHLLSQKQHGNDYIVLCGIWLGVAAALIFIRLWLMWLLRAPKKHETH